MSTQDFRKHSSVLRSIELIEGKFQIKIFKFIHLLILEKTNILHSQYTSSINENTSRQPVLIDDSNVHLQLFFQHLEQLLQIDLKSNTKNPSLLF